MDTGCLRAAKAFRQILIIIRIIIIPYERGEDLTSRLLVSRNALPGHYGWEGIISRLPVGKALNGGQPAG
jgi:hypothetical protein